MSTACNHSLDFGMEGVESTIEILQKENIAFHGTNLNKDNISKATILEKKGFKIGMIAYTFGLNAHSPPQSHPYLVNVLNLNDAVETIDFSQIKAQVKYCHDLQVDFIMTHLHWGMEHEFYPTPAQVKVAHHLAEIGIDAIIGHHPHVVQPMELYRTKRDPHRLVPIYYSLGNLVNYFSAPFLCKSAVAHITLAKGYLNFENPCVYVKKATLLQVIQTVDKDKKVVQLVPNQE
jgi:poly-gamma-glutamate synthesis protein (capsule biosynthesis protein)